MKHLSIACSTLLLLSACAAPSAPRAAQPDQPNWAIAIHGGAGVMQLSAEQEAAYRSSLQAALERGREWLASGASALDTVERVVNLLEDDALFNAGKGSVYTAEAEHELDASIMDGSNMACGAVTGVKTIKNPISLARLVMENSKHVFFSGAGAERFADSTAVERVENSYFDTPGRLRSLQKAMGKNPMGTVGCAALDQHGNLAAATSTGGMTAKQFGRIGDSPMIGAGTYASNASAAISCTGHGEQFIRHTIARDVAAQMEYGGKSLLEAVDHVLKTVLKPGDGGLIAVSKDGEIVAAQNTTGMFRACANAAGLNEVKIWAEE